MELNFVYTIMNNILYFRQEEEKADTLTSRRKRLPAARIRTTESTASSRRPRQSINPCVLSLLSMSTRSSFYFNFVYSLFFNVWLIKALWALVNRKFDYMSIYLLTLQSSLGKSKGRKTLFFNKVIHACAGVSDWPSHVQTMCCSWTKKNWGRH